AHNRTWPAGRVSILAGFVEPGESLEQAVSREVGEETGLRVSGLHYVGSQPWPMPRSLMLGYVARAPGAQEIVVDGEEIAEARGAGGCGGGGCGRRGRRGRCCGRRRCPSPTRSSCRGPAPRCPGPGDVHAAVRLWTLTAFGGQQEVGVVAACLSAANAKAGPF